jgi:Zn-dependent peptidase ImmA (M78 family)
MRRGFKTWAERTAVERRSLLQLRSHLPLPSRTLGNHLGVAIITPVEIVGIPEHVVAQLLKTDPSSWSAVTISKFDRSTIIHNTTHSPRRQESDLMHELAHILCEHKPAQLIQIPNASFALRSYDREQEDEASWLGSCLQIPRVALLWAVRQGMDNYQMADHFNASLDLVKYRRDMTGVNRQISYTATRQ